MYTEYWRLKEKPFENSLDMNFVYMSDQHKEALARLLYTVEERKNCAVLSGDHGTGKTLVRQMFVSRLSGVGSFAIAVIENPLVGIDAMLSDIQTQISGKPAEFSSRGAVMRELRDVFLSKSAGGFHNLVLIDDGQLLDDLKTVEQLRLLMNLYDNKGQSLVTMIFFGQSNMLKTMKASPALLQNISSRWVLNPLTAEQTRDYITHRLSVAGGNGWIIGDDAVEAIHEYTGGIARLINNVADLALYLGMSENAVRVDAVMVGRIIKDLED